ncbi:hypothetical protein H2200_000890 [Cladophialophora chaetospira]|uniref:Enoyl reductase (ER) domain-containing protein n=1 Tax=Cladophialophora chaetospira TaxID=386627 RepID=A0AA39CPL1_9EURO|nr:hypothetical protein H2200_000890 [Cladophialophora chaetospira]
MKAIIATSKTGPAQLIHDRPPPTLRPGYVLVRTHAVAINPADNLYLTYGLAAANTLLGCDYAGVILEVSPECKRPWNVGDRVCGCTRAGDPSQLENGTFAEIVCVKADVGMKIPEGMSFEEACTLGVTVLTTGQCLYQKLKIPFPPVSGRDTTKRGWILVYGGSSAMGTMVMQFAKLSNFTVITTCSPHNFDLVRSYGADHVFDYHRADSSIAEIKGLVQGEELKTCIDCISTPESAEYCAKLLAPGAKYSSLGPVSSPRADVMTSQTMGWSFLGEEWEMMGQKFLASQQDFEFSMAFATLSEELLARSLIRAHPLDLRPGGLDAILKGMEDLKAGKVSAKKIVVTVNQE